MKYYLMQLRRCEEQFTGSNQGRFSFRLADVRNQVIFAVRQEYVELEDQQLLLQPGDEVAIIPPISGG